MREMEWGERDFPLLRAAMGRDALPLMERCATLIQDGWDGGQFEPHAHLLLGGEGDHHHLDYSEENPIIGTGRLLSYPGEKAYSPPRRHHFTHSTRSEGGADFGESLYETELKGGAPSDGKRLRAQGEDSAPLAQLKKLKLRGQQQSGD